jgi:predicted amidohydrolase
MQDLKIALIQSLLHWENIDKNIQHFDSLLDSIELDTDLIILPEMFTTGFSMNPSKYASESMEKGLEWMLSKAKELNCTIGGSLMVKENNIYYNRLYYIDSNGILAKYDKRHLFTMGFENQSYSVGEKLVEINVKGWEIRPLICYDLRFPVWCRNTTNYDILIFHANWPQRRITHWDILLQSRAIENQCYVAACNRVGLDGNNIEHNGSSQVISPIGEVLQKSVNEEKVIYQILSHNLLMETRKNLPFLADKDSFEITS